MNEVHDDSAESDLDDLDSDFVRLRPEESMEPETSTDTTAAQILPSPESIEAAIRALYSKLKPPSSSTDTKASTAVARKPIRPTPIPHSSLNTPEHRITLPRTLPPPEVLRAMYKSSRKKAIKTICEDTLIVDCNLTRTQIIDHFQRTHLTFPQQALEALPIMSRKFQQLASHITDHISSDEVWSRLASIDRNTSPGPSGISFTDLVSRQTCSELARVFKTVLSLGYVPQVWKESHLVLIPKKGRPLAGFVMAPDRSPRRLLQTPGRHPLQTSDEVGE